MREQVVAGFAHAGFGQHALPCPHGQAAQGLHGPPKAIRSRSCHTARLTAEPFGIPLALLGAFVLHLPVYLVVLLVLIGDELMKFLLGLFRFRSQRWINVVVGG